MTATTCDTGTALLRAVLADPASDDCRLIYADYLDEQGEADRAEFVRVQCRIATLNAELMSDEDCDATNCPGCGERRELQRREREMVKLFEWQGFRTAFGLPQHWPAWHLSAGPADWTAPPVPHWCGGVLRRGFVDEIRLPLAAFLEHARDLFSRHPLEHVVLTDREPNFYSQYNDYGDVWVWYRQAATPHLPFSIPAELDTDHLTDYTGRMEAFRPTRDAALAALSAACIRYGRKLAGLPPLG